MTEKKKQLLLLLLLIKWVWEQLQSAPVEVGTYTVKIDVAEGTTYKSAGGLTSTDWTFKITQVDATQKGADTGDSNNIALFSILGILTLCGAGFVYKRRENVV